MSGAVLLAVLAHPDDESFGPGGALARYAREGAEVHICIATDGGAGACDPALLASSGCQTVAELRRRELDCACAAFGATLHVLGYGDSGMAGSASNGGGGTLFQADLEEAAANIAALMRWLRPVAVITHGPDGEYGHPDHIKVHQAVMRALDLLDVAERPQRVYAHAIPRAQVARWVWLMRLLRKDPTRFGENQDIDLTRLGTPDEQMHVRLDVWRHLAVKERASACHRSQGGAVRPRWAPALVWRWLQRREFFRQLYPADPRPHTDLLAG